MSLVPHCLFGNISASCNDMLTLSLSPMSCVYARAEEHKARVITKEPGNSPGNEMRKGHEIECNPTSSEDPVDAPSR